MRNANSTDRDAIDRAYALHGKATKLINERLVRQAAVERIYPKILEIVERTVLDKAASKSVCPAASYVDLREAIPFVFRNPDQPDDTSSYSIEELHEDIKEKLVRDFGAAGFAFTGHNGALGIEMI
jgi:hypothetical protein